MKKLKTIANIIFYTLASIGLVDMALQVFSCGEVRIIRSILNTVFTP